MGWIRGFVSFREDMRELFIEYCAPHQDSKLPGLRREIVKCKNEAGQSVLTDLGFFMGIIPLFISTFGHPIELPYIDIIGLLVTGIAAIRAVTIELMAYDSPFGNLKPIDLHFMKGWNCGAVNTKNALFMLPFVAIIMRIHFLGYDIGMSIVEWYTKSTCG